MTAHRSRRRRFAAFGLFAIFAALLFGLLGCADARGVGVERDLDDLRGIGTGAVAFSLGLLGAACRQAGQAGS